MSTRAQLLVLTPDLEVRLNNALSDLEDLYERFMRDDYKTTEAVAAQQACLNASENICMILRCLRKDTDD